MEAAQICSEVAEQPQSRQYEKCMLNARKVNWDIDKDVIRFRKLSHHEKYLPDGLAGVGQLAFLASSDARFMSRVQGRTYAYIFGLVERFINAKVLELGNDHALGDQQALQALVQFSQEEMKHQELFRRVERLAAEAMPDGYVMSADPDAVAEVVLSKSTWSVLALTCHIEIFTQVHYRESIRPGTDISPLFADIFRYHWLEESQHAMLDELEWQRVHAGCTAKDVDEGVSDFIDLVVAVDGILQAQSQADAAYFLANCDGQYDARQTEEIEAGVLRAYRWQYIVSGAGVERFQKALAQKVTDEQMQRIMTALQPLIDDVSAFVEG